MSTEIKTEEITKISTKVPSLWKVIFHNDDSTPMEFVISLLMIIFKHSEESAKEITLEIHNSGSGIAGIYYHEIAEQKGIEATNIARQNGHPLIISIEKDA
jgi:ATP-dependent Clp protease adaptor protein ClpS